jgi:nucleotide-binding universal stress UspA family protein
MKLLVANDGSRAGLAAVRFAGRIAARDTATAITIITVGVIPGAAEAARRTLDRLRVSGDVRQVRAKPREAIPEAIAREAERMKADLVVIGSEGRDTLREWVVGGVALRLLYVATRPVAVVRPPRRRSRASGLAAVDGATSRTSALRVSGRSGSKKMSS